MSKDDNSQNINGGDASEAELRERLSDAARAGDATAREGCSSITPLSDSHEEGPLKGCHSFAAIDWLETAGCIVWDDLLSIEGFRKLDQAVSEAKDSHDDILINLLNHSLSIFPSGMGSGRQSRMQYRLEWAGVTIGLSSWDSEKRTLQNFYLKVPGDACLIVGAREARKVAHEIVNFLGGTLVDEWVRRIDLAYDLTGISVQDELLPAFLNDQRILSPKQWNVFGDDNKQTAFTVGSRAEGRVRMTVYDKKLEVTAKKSELCQLAMKERRWGGKQPEKAIRIEYQIGKAWLDQFEGMRTADDVLNRLGDIIERLTTEQRPFFRLTSSKVDRVNGHQSRAETHPLWKAIIHDMRVRFGEPHQELKRLDRGSLNGKRAFALIKGILTKLAATQEFMIENIDHACECLRRIHDSNFATDDDWYNSWEKHARKLGTLENVMQFPRKSDF